MLYQLPMMFQSFDESSGYPSFTPSTSAMMSRSISPTLFINKNPIDITESTYTILPYRPFLSNPLGWWASNVLIKGAEALVDLQPEEATAF
jgi:hypothetical protein